MSMIRLVKESNNITVLSLTYRRAPIDDIKSVRTSNLMAIKDILRLIVQYVITVVRSTSPRLTRVSNIIAA